MKLLTNIKPRTNGTVSTALDGVAYVFKSEVQGGPLLCDVPNDDHIARLLLTDRFEPADEADHDRAFALLGQVAGAEAAAGADGDGGADEDDDDDSDDEPVDMSALPQEANTPPKASARPRAGRTTR